MVKDGRSSGFTILELLFAVSITGVLAGLAMQNLKMYRQGAYAAVAESLLNDTKKALEIGRADISERNAEWFYAWRDTAGPVNDVRGYNFLPGLMNPQNTQVSAWYVPPCDEGVLGDGCLVEGATIRHCKAQKVYSWMKLKDGTETLIKFETPSPC